VLVIMLAGLFYLEKMRKIASPENER